METVVAKIISMPDIEYMYDNENRPGTCPICHNTLEKIPDVHYKVEKKEPIYCAHTTDIVLLRRSLKNFAMKTSTPILLL